MSRGKKFVALALALGGLWAWALFRLVSRHSLDASQVKDQVSSVQHLPWHDPVFIAVFAAPFLALALFGIYAVVTIVTQVIRFEDKKEAAAELAQDLITARADLQRRGYQFVN
ncbi:conserved hypothetical protein [Neospora caninum Liverpool]|uniref:Dolichol-phosphate mannosyltransferase subunit 3 n=1 Tax=Neospora caninum (strain Liverpool) TaxID=572307 RepID=F0VG66_NEOCL|nr:conserved hypothetical protein [Neospora caninum Liverpool]CBZ52710.1 conserved hypothetical protein [Neospora caninum Liverpool]CEL66690.1 TPA: hypothetical protein BN1204_024990 [Neospora caninum Liverpool]|eukprot:XP_003882742.1 conserved hypothetical protein [Neospora caninum Liverpool]